MEVAIIIGFGILAILFLIGWIMFAMEHPFLAMILSLLMLD